MSGLEEERFRGREPNTVNTIASITQESSLGKQPCRTTRFKFHGLHVESIGREAFEAIADEQLFGHQQGPPGATQLTFRDVLDPDPPNDRRRRIKFGAGLLLRVVMALQAKAIDVHCEPPPPWPWTDGQPIEPCCQFLVRAVGRLRSLSIVPKLADRLRNVAELCRLQPEANIVLVAKNNNEAKAVARMLKALTQRKITPAHEIPNSHPWLYVSTSAGLRCSSTPFWDFNIFLDAEVALSMTSVEYLASSAGGVRIGFLTRDERELLPTERCILESLFGPVIYRPGDEVPEPKSQWPGCGRQKTRYRREARWSVNAIMCGPTTHLIG
jgi:hypothetical protein